MAQDKRKERKDGSRAPEREQTPLEAVAAEAGHGGGILMEMREWLDALIIAFVIAMFIRTFVVELFKIPSGSMTPTLLGDAVAEGVAMDREGRSSPYLFVRLPRTADQFQVYRKDPRGHYVYEGVDSANRLTTSQRDVLQTLHVEEHRIFVNKFAYWFSKPQRGDIVIFRVPFDAETTEYRREGHRFQVPRYNRYQSVYVKRAVAFGGERVRIEADGRLLVDGDVATEPPVFQHLRYSIQPADATGFDVQVPEGEAFVFGDNTDNSQDSRYWDGVPYENLRGRAIFRYWPPRKASFLK